MDLPELSRIENIIEKCKGKAEVRQIATVKVGDREFPIHACLLGSKDRTKPTLGWVGGVHGLERVGTHVILAHLEGLLEQMEWDKDIVAKLQDCRLVCIPLLNPGGMAQGMRSNPNGVDLMRNAPVEAIVKPARFLGGHRYSNKLPWFRGVEGAPMEIESQALVDFIKQEVFPSEAALVLDCHSGFGFEDRLWYPYAKTSEPFARIHEVNRIKELLDRSLPNHIYRVEAQSLSYTTHGDLWDYLFDEHQKLFGEKAPLFIPWTLEMGSWIWIRKNPIQIFTSAGPFNPIKIHRHKRTMRRHIPLMDFFFRVVKNHKSWVGM